MLFNNSLFQLLSNNPALTCSQTRRIFVQFAFCHDERFFVRRLLIHKQQYWAFRCNQTLSCGDFIVVNMSSPSTKRRKIHVIELKKNAPLKIGGGGVGIQFLRAGHAVAEITESGIVTADAGFNLVSGDADAVYRYL